MISSRIYCTRSGSALCLGSWTLSQSTCKKASRKSTQSRQDEASRSDAAQIEGQGKVGVEGGVAKSDRARAVAARMKAGETPSLRLMGIDGRGLEVAPAGVADMEGAAGDGAVGPEIDELEDQRRMDRDRRMERRGQSPGAKAHAGDELAFRPGRMQGNAPA